MLSQRTRYALRALVRLAEAHGGPPLSSHDIAEAVAAPPKYLEAVLLDLKRHGVLVSLRGNRGGYQLARAPADITFAEVIACLDEGAELAPCAAPGGRRCATCPEPEVCAAQPALAAAHEALAASLRAWTLERACRAGEAASVS